MLGALWAGGKDLYPDIRMGLERKGRVVGETGSQGSAPFLDKQRA